ncbi:MAG TPA: hypothetical protein V6D03_04745, partial [Candidatus Caenarcaniphilales bacterium]
IAPLVECYLNPHDPIAHPTALLTGQDLMSGLQLCPGPQIGQLLQQLEIAQAEGRVSTPEEALALARGLLE